MGIRINEINVQNLGPISNKQWKLSKINLFYGKNESGKTYLVEFLIQSLFKNISYPGMRKLSSTGKVSVQGLEDAIVSLYPNSKKKLEEYLKEEDKTIPTNISRLLVVRAGELSLVDDHQKGYSQSILEEYLSNSGLITTIRNKIPVTVQKSSVVGGVIRGSRQGPIKDYFIHKDDQKDLDDLLDKVNTDYSAGLRASLQGKFNESCEEFKIEKQAKYHLAYSHDKEIKQLTQELEKISTDMLQQIENDLCEFRLNNGSFQRSEEIFQAKITESKEYPWLKAALEDYPTLLKGSQHTTKNWLLFLAVFLLLGTIFSILIHQPYLAIMMLLIGSGVIFSYIRNLSQSVSCMINNNEIN